MFEKVCRKQLDWKVSYQVTSSDQETLGKELVPTFNTGIQRKTDEINNRVALKGTRRDGDGLVR